MTPYWECPQPGAPANGHYHQSTGRLKCGSLALGASSLKVALMSVDTGGEVKPAESTTELSHAPSLAEQNPESKVHPAWVLGSSTELLPLGQGVKDFLTTRFPAV